MDKKAQITESLTVHPGSGDYICKVLGIRFPNIRFTLPDISDKYIYATAKHEVRIDQSVVAAIHDTIAVLEIVYQLTGGKITEVIHG
jgi:hypothetical protein